MSAEASGTSRRPLSSAMLIRTGLGCRITLPSSHARKACPVKSVESSTMPAGGVTCIVRMTLGSWTR
eukprot:3602646-Prymnesium_polylepis.1